MMTIFGRPRARAGHIEFDGQDITGVPTHEIARLRIAQSPEGRRIFPRMSVAENLQMGADATDCSEAERAGGLERIFALFPRLKERMTQRGGTLSGGEQQMLAIGRALMSRPRLLMLDEPSLGLAPLIARQIFDAIRTLNRQDGLTVLIVEQNANHALKLAHRGYVMVNGLITLSGNRQRIAAAPGNPRCLSGRRPAGVAFPAALSLSGSSRPSARGQAHTAQCCDFALDPDVFHPPVPVVMGPAFAGATDRAATCCEGTVDLPEICR